MVPNLRSSEIQGDTYLIYKKMKWKGGQTAPKGKQFLEEGHTA